MNKRNAALAWICAVGVMLAGAKPCSAQTLTTGRIQGNVVDEVGRGVENAVVTLRDVATSVTTTRELSRSGEFSFLFLTPGEYQLVVEAFGLRPLRIESIDVYSSETTNVQANLSASTDVNASVEVREHGGAARSALTHFSSALITRFPESSRTISSIGRLSSFTDGALQTEGLPAYLSGTRIEGLGVGAASTRGYATSAALPLTAVRHAELVTSADVEWSGSAAPALSVHLLDATPSLALSTFADFTTGPETAADLSAPAFSGLRAAAIVSGPLVRDTSGFMFGFEFSRIETPLAVAGRVDSAVVNAIELTGQSYTRTRLAESNAFAGFGKINWQLNERHALSVSSAITSMPSSNVAPAFGNWVGARGGLEGFDALVSASLRSQLGQNAGQEFRLSWDRSVRDHDVFDQDIDATSTFVLDDGFSLGSDPSLFGRFESNTLRARETVHLWSAAHHVKGGAQVELSSYDQLLSRARGATFFFSSPADLVNAQGFATQTSGEATSSFSMPRFAVFIQDEWSLNSRLRILLGARYDIEVPPIDDVVVNEEFLTISGIRADSNLTRRGRVSPRFEFEWRPDLEGRWSLRGTAGIWDMPMDPTLVGEVLANHGVVRVSRNFGTFTSWPDATDTTGARALTLPAPGFQGARSKRGMLTLTRQFTPGVQLSLAGTYRRTDFLPVRRDLNRLAVSAGVDQHGRPLFGALQQQGSLIRAQNESNRRFPQFDIVSALGVDGWSEYIAGSAALQVQLSNRVFLHGNYTYSQTEDNWFMARESGFADAISPFSSTGEFAEWTTGVSDFDVPHRAVLGAEITLPMLQGLRIAGLYRYQSGYPFTPGFRAGVDANADGSARNDPAFIDLDMAGLNELTDEWPCLRTSAGTFAERNSCRAPAASFLDARVAVGLLSSRGRSVEIVIDALNLVSSGRAEIDRSLFLIDPTGTLTTDANGTVNVPLLVNHNFGEPLLRAAAERALRVGARVRF